MNNLKQILQMCKAKHTTTDTFSHNSTGLLTHSRTEHSHSSIRTQCMRDSFSIKNTQRGQQQARPAKSPIFIHLFLFFLHRKVFSTLLNKKTFILFFFAVAGFHLMHFFFFLKQSTFFKIS